MRFVENVTFNVEKPHPILYCNESVRVRGSTKVFASHSKLPPRHIRRFHERLPVMRCLFTESFTPDHGEDDVIPISPSVIATSPMRHEIPTSKLSRPRSDHLLRQMILSKQRSISASVLDSRDDPMTSSAIHNGPVEVKRETDYFVNDVPTHTTRLRELSIKDEPPAHPFQPKSAQSHSYQSRNVLYYDATQCPMIELKHSSARTNTPSRNSLLRHHTSSAFREVVPIRGSYERLSSAAQHGESSTLT